MYKTKFYFTVPPFDITDFVIGVLSDCFRSFLCPRNSLHIVNFCLISSGSVQYTIAGIIYWNLKSKRQRPSVLVQTLPNASRPSIFPLCPTDENKAVRWTLNQMELFTKLKKRKCRYQHILKTNLTWPSTNVVPSIRQIRSMQSYFHASLRVRELFCFLSLGILYSEVTDSRLFWKAISTWPLSLSVNSA